MQIDKEHIVNLVRYVLSEIHPVNGVVDLDRAETIVDDYLEDINYTPCCTELRDEYLQPELDKYKNIKIERTKGKSDM